MSNAWYLAPSLTLLRAEVNRRWPNRDRKSDGAIGDAAHSARVSDHNPNARRSVNALDIDRDGIDPMLLVNVAISDARTNYVIFNRTIWSRSRGFKSRAYTGSNPHTGHVHISIRQARDAEQDTRPWGIATATASKPGLPSSGVNTTTGGLSMSDIATLISKIDYLSEQVKAVQQSAHDDRTYMKSQLRAVADLVGGRAAIDQRNRDTRAAVEAAVRSLGLGGSVDAAKLTDEIAAGLAAKLGG